MVEIQRLQTDFKQTNSHFNFFFLIIIKYIYIMFYLILQTRDILLSIVYKFKKQNFYNYQLNYLYDISFNLASITKHQISYFTQKAVY